MTRFAFKAYDSRGRLAAGEIDGETQTVALDVLARRGLFPLEIQPAAPGGRGGRSLALKSLLGGRALSTQDLAVLARELATLSAADVPIDEALRIVALQPRMRARTRELIEGVLAGVSSGSSLSEALAAAGGAVPEHFWRLIRAGETSGTLPGVLAEIAQFQEQSVKLRRQLMTAMLYPMFLLAAAVITVAIIVAVMVPALMPLFRDAGVAAPFALSFLAALERLLVGHWPLALLLALALIGAGLWLRRQAGVADAWDALVLRTPVAGALIQRADTARLARILATLLRNGVPMLEALRVTAGVVRNRRFRAAILEAEARVNHGGTLVGALTDCGLVPSLALRLMGIGERSGQLPDMLARVADIYDHDRLQRLERILAIATPAVTVSIGGVIGFLMLTVISAMLSLNETILR